MIKLSIIIPIYNAEKYLCRCVNSCLSQDLSKEEYEILLCDDGSVDDSLKIAQQLQSVNDCIRVFTQKNSGAGSARNLGLINARGQYVMFVDSDDYLKPNSINDPLKQSFEKNLDVCRYLLVNELLADGRCWVNVNPVPSKIVYNGIELISNKNVPFDTVCSALYRRDFLKVNNLFFSNLTSSEDVVFTLCVYMNADRVMYDNTQVYVYEIKDGTRGHSKDYKRKISFIKNELFIASFLKKTAELNNSKKLNKSLLLRSNSTTISAFLALWRLKNSVKRSVAKEIFNYAESLLVYPIKGRTFSWRTTIFAHLLLNHKSIIISLFCKE